MVTVFFIFVLALLFLVISIFLFLGKGSWLIAGYNTASAEEKAKYNEKKLSKAVGAVTSTVSFSLCIMAYLGYRVESGEMGEYQMLPFAIIFIVAIIISIIIASIYIGKKCKNK